MKGIDVKYKNFFVKLSLKNMIAGKVKRVTTIKLNEKNQIHLGFVKFHLPKKNCMPKYSKETLS